MAYRAVLVFLTGHFWQELGLSTDVPRPIITANVALRMVHVRQDPLEQVCGCVGGCGWVWVWVHARARERG